MSTIFSAIIRGDIPAEKLYENEHLIVIKDIEPKAEVHLLIIPKKEIVDLQSIEDQDLFLLGEVVKAANKLAKDLPLNGYRLLVNNGKNAGQMIFHLHFHLLSGKLKGAF